MYNTVLLNGTWELAGFDEGADGWSRAETPYPVPAPVPGEVHPALEAAGLLPDLGFGANAEKARWVAEKDWWYRRTITVPEDYARTRTFLVFEAWTPSPRSC